MIFPGTLNIKFILSFSAFNSNSSFNDSDYTYTLLQDTTHSDDMEIEGIVVDAVKIKIGKEYFDLFYLQRNQVENLQYHSITITEKILPKFGSQIAVHIENQLLFRQVFQLRYEKYEEMGNYVLMQAYRYVQKLDEMQNHLHGEDL